MPASRTVQTFVLLALAVTPARAQTPPPDEAAIRSGVEQVLSLATFGVVTVRDQDAVVTQSGADYRVRLPLAGFSAPRDAAIEAVVRPLANGLLDITSMAFPSTGTLEQAGSGPSGRTTYAIGQQRIAGKIDPALALPSSYEAEFGNVRLNADRGDMRIEQTVGRYALNGTVSTDRGGLLTLASQGSGTGFRLLGHGADGFASDVALRAVAGHFSVDGLDRARGTRLLAAMRGLAATAETQGASPEQHQSLGAMVEAADGLLNRFDAEETLEDLRFAIGGPAGAAGGTIGRMSIAVTGDAVDKRLNGRLGIVVDGLATTALAGENAMFVPHHVELRTVLGGVRTGKLMALLRAAAGPDADLAALQGQAMALLADPQTRIGIEALSFDSGPLQVSGTATAVPRANGQLGAEIHLVASGVDALMAQAQSRPNLQRIMPMVFMAKGMGRQQGNTLVWDISLGDGPPKINGVPFGQPAGRTR